jgi:ABC-2 type transport system permease protein
MVVIAALSREARFMLRDQAILGWLALTLILSSIAVWSGVVEVSRQKSSIETLLAADREDRDLELARQSDWGGAAYYAFHLTYDPPTSFAFAALGQRDAAPWRHRIRMLAVEGQIYENDVGNPEFALLGRFDLAFLTAFVLPLILIMMLHDSRAGERTAGRYELLAATSGGTRSLWIVRTSLRTGAVCLCVIVPLLAGCVTSAASWNASLAGVALVIVHGAFWAVLCYWLASWNQAAPAILATLTGVWIVLAVVVPVGGRMIIDQVVPIPSGADIAMTQREAVNEAWDLPKPATMMPFVERHPEWSTYAAVEQPFEWKWYYAFQQVGDQKTEALSKAYSDGRRKRDHLAARLSLLAPPALIERAFQRLAGTDMRATLAYEEAVRAFHAALRAFHYPKLFRDEPYERARLDEMPLFAPDGRMREQ